MKAIKQRLMILVVLAVMALLVSLILFIKGFTIFMIDMKVVFALLLLAATALIGLIMLEYSRYNSAKLIIENKIIDIQVAKIEQNSTETIEFIISCFGILLGSKVVKFNIDGVRLKEMKITHDTIYILYGKDKKNKSIQLLHSSIGKEEIKEIAERFQYETGITPNVIN